MMGLAWGAASSTLMHLLRVQRYHLRGVDTSAALTDPQNSLLQIPKMSSVNPSNKRCAISGSNSGPIALPEHDYVLEDWNQAGPGHQHHVSGRYQQMFDVAAGLDQNHEQLPWYGHGAYHYPNLEYSFEPLHESTIPTSVTNIQHKRSIAKLI